VQKKTPPVVAAAGPSRRPVANTPAPKPVANAAGITIGPVTSMPRLPRIPKVKQTAVGTVTATGPPPSSAPRAGTEAATKVAPSTAVRSAPSSTATRPSSASSVSGATAAARPSAASGPTEAAGVTVERQRIPTLVRQRPEEITIEDVEDEFAPRWTEREQAEGRSQRQEELAEMAFQENTLLYARLREEAEEAEELRRSRDQATAELEDLRRRLDDQLQQQEDEVEEGELVGEFDDGLSEVDSVRNRSWLAQLLSNHNRSKVTKEEDDPRWVNLGKQKSTSSYLKSHWQDWSERDISTDRDRIAAMLEQHVDRGGLAKTMAEIVKSMSDVKLALISGTNKANLAGRTAPHAAFSSLCLDIDNIITQIDAMSKR